MGRQSSDIGQSRSSLFQYGRTGFDDLRLLESRDRMAGRGFQHRKDERCLLLDRLERQVILRAGDRERHAAAAFYSKCQFQHFVIRIHSVSPYGNAGLWPIRNQKIKI